MKPLGAGRATALGSAANASSADHLPGNHSSVDHSSVDHSSGVPSSGVPSSVSTVRASAEPAFRAIVARAAARFRPAGRSHYYFARGKLGGDPVFAALLRDGRIATGARVVDIGSGIGVLPALLAAAERCDAHSASEWPDGWRPPASHWTLRGFDLRPSAIAAGQRALSDKSDRVSLAVGDARTEPLPDCEVVVVLDMLHYIDPTAQRTLLTRAHAALAPGGTLLTRVADTAPDWRFRLTLVIDWLAAFARGISWPELHCHPLDEWIALLEAVGFSVVAQPMSEGTPFANVLLVATKTEPPRAG